MAAEKARLKAEYRKIMNEQSNSGRKEIMSQGNDVSTTSASSKETKKNQKEKDRKQEDLDWIENEKMEESRKKLDAANEKTRLKAEYRKIMNEQSTFTTNESAMREVNIEF